MLLVGLKKMNKLLLVGVKNTLAPGNYLISYKNKTTIDIDGEVNLAHYETTGYDLNLNLLDNAILNLNYLYIVSHDLKLTINLNNNTTLDAHITLVNEGSHKIEINLNMLGNNNKAKITLRVINKNNHDNITVAVTGNIAKNTCDNELLEDLKGLILKEDTIKICPNIEVDTNEVIANHLVTIGSFNKEDLFYLKTKGLSELTAKKLLLKRFLINNLPEDLQKHLKLEVIKFE